MYTIGELADRAGLSRSTLLYYDRLGLLRPSARTAANYRSYTVDDARRLERIVDYRALGIPLADIRRVLDAPERSLGAVLANRLAALQAEIGRLRRQQELILPLLPVAGARRAAGLLDKEQWVAMLRASGLDERGMNRWHVEFERTSGPAHEEFLRSLGIPDREIVLIRRRSREGLASE